MLRIPDLEEAKPDDRIAGGAGRSPEAARVCTARVAVAVVDDRPIALVFPASRRVVLDRLGKLLRADHVRLAPSDEVDRFLGRPPIGAADRPMLAPHSIPLLMDASLLSAPSLVIRHCGEDGSVRLILEDWLATAEPAVGFFTEPARGHDA